MFKYLRVIFLTLSAIALHTVVGHAQDKPIALHPKNPHYFLYRNKPTILITSAEHYGSVVNLDFDFNVYLDALKSKNMNLTRVFTGAYVEPRGAFNIEGNALSPAPNRFVSPWARTSEPGYMGGGNKFDLTKWDDAYFNRLLAFVNSAQQRGIVVEVTLFCPFYDSSQWKVSPMNTINNVNNVGAIPKDSVYTLDRDPGLLAVQESLVRKIVAELNGLNNVIFEICNEPYFGGVTMPWQHHIASVIEDTEKNLKMKHLISQNIANDSAVVTNPYPGVSVFNFHYATPPNAVKQNYHLNKVIGDNETGFRGQADSTYRKEGWEIILAGGALYNNLDYSFAPGFEKGNYKYPVKQPGGGSDSLRTQLSYLQNFMSSFQFIEMKPDRSFITKKSARARTHVLSQTGKQYAVYVLHGGQITFTVNLPAGQYSVDWMNPVTGKFSDMTLLKHKGGSASISSPPYDFDIALRIMATK